MTNTAKITYLSLRSSLSPGKSVFFRERNLVEQILDQAEWTEEAAYESSDQSSDEDQKANDIVSHLEIPAADYRLDRTDRTGTDGTWAGIAVQTRNTHIFELSGIDLSGEKSGYMAVCKKRPESLDCVALPFIYFERCFFGTAFFGSFFAASAAGSAGFCAAAVIRFLFLCILCRCCFCGISGCFCGLIYCVIQFLYTPYRC